MSSLNPHVFSEFPQALAIEVSGPDVLLLAGNAPTDSPTPQATIPDIVQLFADAVNLQMFAVPSSGTQGSIATVVSSQFDPARVSHSWCLQLAGVSPGCLRVLANLLLARKFDVANVAGAVENQAAVPFDPRRVAYPGVCQPLPFQLDYQDPSPVSRARLVALEFSTPPTDATLNALFAHWQVWCQLLMFGGYPPEDMEPERSALLPDRAIFLDEYTVKQSFSDALGCDDAAFNAVINHARTLDACEIPVEKLTIR